MSVGRHVCLRSSAVSPPRSLSTPAKSQPRADPIGQRFKTRPRPTKLLLFDQVSILRELSHENIILMLDYFETKTDFCVVTELAQGELFEILEDDGKLPEDIVRSISAQLVHSLHYLHSHRVIHRDMKPQNILICADGAAHGALPRWPMRCDVHRHRPIVCRRVGCVIHGVDR